MKKLLPAVLVALLMISSTFVCAQEIGVQKNKIELIALDLKKATMYFVAAIGLGHLKDVFEQIEYRFENIANEKPRWGTYYTTYTTIVDASKFASVSYVGSVFSEALCVLCAIQSASRIISAIYKATKKNSQKKEVFVSE